MICKEDTAIHAGVPCIDCRMDMAYRFTPEARSVGHSKWQLARMEYNDAQKAKAAEHGQ
ncbi:MAG: hypothetical protein ABUJ92_00710 [Desulfobacterales bacterium]